MHVEGFALKEPAVSGLQVIAFWGALSSAYTLSLPHSPRMYGNTYKMETKLKRAQADSCDQEGKVSSNVAKT